MVELDLEYPGGGGGGIDRGGGAGGGWSETGSFGSLDVDGMDMKMSRDYRKSIKITTQRDTAFVLPFYLKMQGIKCQFSVVWM